MAMEALYAHLFTSRALEGRQPLKP